MEKPVETFEIEVESHRKTYRLFTERAFVSVPATFHHEKNSPTAQVQLAFHGGEQSYSHLMVGQALKVNYTFSDSSGFVEVRLLELPDSEDDGFVARLLVTRFIWNG